MALRDQPYLPLYVQDFLTDENLIECSAKSTGVYVRIMCIMHKSENYGKFLLRQKDRQKDRQIENFAVKLLKHLPYDYEVILSSLEELIEFSVLKIEGDYLIQKRMVNDNKLSEIRALAGKKGANSTNKKNKYFAAAKHSANTEYENEYENEYELKDKEEVFKKIFVQIEESEKWKTDLALQLRIEIDVVQEKLKEFMNELKLKDDYHKGIKKIKSHFINWLKIEIKKNTNGKQVSKVEGYRQAADRIFRERGIDPKDYFEQPKQS